MHSGMGMVPLHDVEGNGTYGGAGSICGADGGGGWRTVCTGRYGGDDGSGKNGGSGGDVGGRASTQTQFVSIGHPSPCKPPYTYCTLSPYRCR